MNISLKWLLVAGLVTLSAPSLADHRHDYDSAIRVDMYSPYLGVHYREGGHSRYGHRHGYGCGHHWDGRVWGRPVPYHRNYRYYGHHWKKHWKQHHRRHHRAEHRRRHHYDGHHGGDRRHDRRRDRDDHYDRRDRRRDDHRERRRHD